MNRRAFVAAVLCAPAATRAAAGLTLPSSGRATQLSAASTFSSRTVVLAYDPAIEAAVELARAHDSLGATFIELAPNRLRQWHEELEPLLRRGQASLSGLTHAADAAFYCDAARELNMRLVSFATRRNKPTWTDETNVRRMNEGEIRRWTQFSSWRLEATSGNGGSGDGQSV